jgi:hypothetical protein
LIVAADCSSLRTWPHRKRNAVLFLRRLLLPEKSHSVIKVIVAAQAKWTGWEEAGTEKALASHTGGGWLVTNLEDERIAQGVVTCGWKCDSVRGGRFGLLLKLWAATFPWSIRGS